MFPRTAQQFCSDCKIMEKAQQRVEILNCSYRIQANFFSCTKAAKKRSLCSNAAKKRSLFSETAKKVYWVIKQSREYSLFGYKAEKTSIVLQSGEKNIWSQSEQKLLSGSKTVKSVHQILKQRKKTSIGFQNYKKRLLDSKAAKNRAMNHKAALKNNHLLDSKPAKKIPLQKQASYASLKKIMPVLSSVCLSLSARLSVLPNMACFCFESSKNSCFRLQRCKISFQILKQQKKSRFGY